MTAASTPLRGRLIPWLLALTSGALLILCYPPFNQGWLIWIALAPLAAAVWYPRAETRAPSTRLKRIFASPFWLGYVTGVTFFTGTFHWLAALGKLFESPALYFLPLLLGAYLAIFPGFWAWFLHRLVTDPAQAFPNSIRNLAYGALSACAWVAAEWVRSWLFSGFEWNTLAVAMRNDIVMLQLAAFTGAHGLSWLAAFTGTMFVIILRRILAELGPDFLKRVRWEFSFTMAVVAAVFSYGARTVLAPAPNSQPLRVAAIQPNIPQEDRFHEREKAREILDRIARNHAIAASVQPPPQLIIWPEAVMPGGLFVDEDMRKFGREAVATGDFGLLLGSLDYDQSPATPEDLDTYNSAILLTRHGERVQSFRKIHLVIFGEYLPFRSIAPGFITDLIPGDLARGKDFTTLDLDTPPIKLGPLVCFEDTVPEIVAGVTKKGAQLLVNITNDGWFLRTVGPEQHLANAVLRAVEFRRPMVRCANTGVTCAIDQFGRVDRWTENFHEAVGIGTIHIPLDQPLTLYARYGRWFAYVCAAITVCALLQMFRRKE